MVTLGWQLRTPIDAVIFDCDGTLSRIEGIDELAKNNGASEAVLALTAEAMGRSGLNPELYHQRLALVHPTERQVLALAQTYLAAAVEDAQAVIALLQRLQKRVYIVSAGINPAVTDFGVALGVPSTQITAVNVMFDEHGHYREFDRTTGLIYRDGKRDIVARIQVACPRVAYVGDGMNDVAVMDLVQRFVGYGGVFYREKIAAMCEFYIKTASMATILPLVLTAEEVLGLNAEESNLYSKALKAAYAGEVEGLDLP